MKIKITGINGYLGTLLSSELKKRNHEVAGISREMLYGPTEKLAAELEGCKVVINLAGASILQRWTKANKDIIYKSRIDTTLNLVQVINHLSENKRPEKFISASAIGIYKAGLKHDENSRKFDDGFLGKVVTDWEEQLETLPTDVKKTVFRIGPVIGKNSQIIRQLKLLFQVGLGGKIASGEQPFPFIHEKDIVAAFVQAVENDDFEGTFNLVAPDQINNATFTKTLAGVLHRPAVFTVPAFALNILYGEAAEMLTRSPEVTPQRLTDLGFRFQYPDIQSALTQALK